MVVKQPDQSQNHFLNKSYKLKIATHFLRCFLLMCYKHTSSSLFSFLNLSAYETFCYIHSLKLHHSFEFMPLPSSVWNIFVENVHGSLKIGAMVLFYLKRMEYFCRKCSRELENRGNGTFLPQAYGIFL